MGDMLVCDDVCLPRCGADFWCPRRTIRIAWQMGFMTQVLLGGSAFRQIRDSRNSNAFS